MLLRCVNIVRKIHRVLYETDKKKKLWHLFYHMVPVLDVSAPSWSKSIQEKVLFGFNMPCFSYTNGCLSASFGCNRNVYGLPKTSPEFN